MKTSKYISIAFVLFIFGAIFILFIDSKFHIDDKSEFTTVDKKLELFSVIVAEKGARFHLHYNSDFKFQGTLFRNEETYHFPDYNISNDTLRIFESNENIFPIKIYCNSITSIIGKSESDIRLYKFQTDSLNIEITNGKINGTLGNYGVKKLSIKASQNSNIGFHQSKIEFLDITLSQSTSSIFNNDIIYLTAHLTNESNLFGSSQVNLSLTKDNSSKYQLRSKPKNN